jgi:hypothetical protein
MTTSVQMNDWRGNPIVPGSIVVYPGRKGSHQWMMEAEVLEIVQVWEWNQFVWAIRVQPMRQGRYSRTNMKPVKLTALERVTVVGHAANDLEKVHADH